ncbi:CU044_2847 family protein [Micromonospora sp. NPDC126480]|uniref:CU044_2847 family protein n=1 Tax=Micromonospora sp. NPDC126480 TaxID=3155312 RepID=UPI00332407F8
MSIEVGPGTGGGSNGGLSESFGVLASVAGACADAIAKVGQDKRPSTMEVTFGLVALEDGALVVGMDSAQASFAVKLTWTGGGDAGSAAEFAEDFD